MEACTQNYTHQRFFVDVNLFESFMFTCVTGIARGAKAE